MSRGAEEVDWGQGVKSWEVNGEGGSGKWWEEGEGREQGKTEAFKSRGEGKKNEIWRHGSQAKGCFCSWDEGIAVYFCSDEF